MNTQTIFVLFQCAAHSHGSDSRRHPTKGLDTAMHFKAACEFHRMKAPVANPPHHCKPEDYNGKVSLRGFQKLRLQAITSDSSAPQQAKA